MTARGISNSPWWKWGKTGGRSRSPSEDWLELVPLLQLAQTAGRGTIHMHSVTPGLCVCVCEIRLSSRLHNHSSVEMSFEPIKKFANERTRTKNQFMVDWKMWSGTPYGWCDAITKPN